MSAIHYLDNAATTAVKDSVFEAMRPYFCQDFGNPSSLHQMGLDAAKAIKSARHRIAEALGAEANQLVFTSGGTESNNLALRSTVKQLGRRGQHLICSAVEHPSVLNTCRDLAERQGFELTEIKPGRDGQILKQDLLEALRPDTILVSIMHVQNETGHVFDVQGLARAVKQANPLTVFHSDGVQALGKDLGTVSEVDLYSFSGHKIHAPKGIGGLIVRSRARLRPVLTGGGQESNRRSGTENVPGIVALAQAVAEACAQRELRNQRWTRLRERLLAGFEDLDLAVNSPERGCPNIVNVSVPGFPAEVLLHALEQRAVFVSNGAACASGKNSESHVLTALGLAPERRSSALRFSFGDLTREQDIDAALEALKDSIEELRPVAERMSQLQRRSNRKPSRHRKRKRKALPNDP